MSKRAKEISMIVCPATPKHCRQTEASILPFDDGRLLLGYTDFYGGDWHDSGPARIMGKWSRDEGETWSRPFLMQENAGRLNCMEASLLRLPSGRILLSYLKKDSEPTKRRKGLLHVMVKWSDDECKTWSPAIQVSQGHNYWCGCHDRLLRLSTGRILVTSAAETAHVWISDDDGATWRMCRKPVSGGGEPTVVETGPAVAGSLKMFLRTTAGNIWIARSGDGGETWGDLDKWGPYSASAPCMVRRIPGSDDLLLLWSNCAARSNLTAAVSQDGGHIWDNYRILEEHEGWPLFRSHCYPSLAFLNGNAHITYWETHRYTKCERLFHLVYRRLPIAWFYQRPKRRPALFDLKRIVTQVFYPNTVFDGERRTQLKAKSK